MKNIEVYHESHNFISDYLPLISFKTQYQKEVVEKYILYKVEIFFKKMIKINIDVEKSQIIYSKVITEKDFPDLSQKEDAKNYFYDNIFLDLGKRLSSKKLEFTPKWGITFDEKCAPISISYLAYGFDSYSDKKPIYKVFRDNNNIPYYRYGTIDINGKPIFYYIYFSLQEILDIVRQA